MLAQTLDELLSNLEAVGTSRQAMVRHTAAELLGFSGWPILAQEVVIEWRGEVPFRLNRRVLAEQIVEAWCARRVGG